MEKLLLKACQNGQKGVVMSFLKKDGINVNNGNVCAKFN